MAHIAKRIAKLSDQTLEVGKAVQSITLQLNSWWNIHGGKWWYDGFCSTEWAKTAKEFDKQYAKALKLLEELPQQMKEMKLRSRDVKASGLKHKPFEQAQAEFERNMILLKASYNSFRNDINPLTSKNEDIKAAYNNSNYVEDFEKFQADYAKWQGIQAIPYELKREIAEIERELLGHDLDQVRYDLNHLGRSATDEEKSALNHLHKAFGMIKYDNPNWRSIHQLLTIIQGELGGSIPKGQEKEVQQHRLLFDVALKKVEGIIKKLDAHYAKIPRPKRSERPVYKDYTLQLTTEAKLLYDDWWQELINISNTFIGISTEFSALARQVKRTAPSTELPDMPDKPTVWHEKLMDIALDMLHERSGLDDWTEDQLAKLNELVTPKTRLLLADETMGIVELPVLIVRGYIDHDGFIEMRRENFDIDRALGSYQIIKNALLMGVRADEVDGLSSLGEAFLKLVDITQDEDLKVRLKKLRPIGPVIRKQAHVYAVLVPTKVFDTFHFEKWDIQPKMMK